MNGSILLLPFVLVRYGLLYLLSPDALKRAAFFPPRNGHERAASWIYQLSTVLLLVCLCFLRVQPASWWFYLGLLVYGAGTALLVLSTVHFASPSTQSINQNGLYRLSRNPMYIAYFVYFLGCALLTKSLLLFLFLAVFQISSHWMILSEERWCRETFGEAYIEYTKRVRRYL